MRIAMWSGPRNLSTALMYAFAARGDCAVWDEPFYAAYLAATGIDHPMRDEIIAAGITDPERVGVRCIGAIPDDKPHFYQKHMTLHMIPQFDRRFMHGVQNVFLIRHPARVVASYAKKREAPTFDDLGYARQSELFDGVAQHQGHPPTVIDSADILADPQAALTRLCQKLGLAFTERMLTWPAGPKPYDGVWAPHWYGAVHKSTGFGAPEGPLPDLPPEYARLADQALPYYEALSNWR
jgi:Sulfotransferase domain